MTEFVINGKFAAERMQGVVRYAREMCLALDDLLEGAPYTVELALPRDAADVPDFKNIRTFVVGAHTGIRWEQTDLRRYMRKHPGAIGVNFCNTKPLFTQPGITTIHDIMYKVNPSHYTTLRNRVSRLWHMLQYAHIAKHELRIITDSEFSAREIARCYPAAAEKLQVIPCGWQHVLRYEKSADWRERYPELESGRYFFSMATLAKNKNGRWILEVAKRNPGSLFAIAGKRYETEGLELPANVRLLGFVSDADACALIQNCRAFLYPSLYEGFGLPPLEALALGADVVSSNTTSLPEVLGGSARYIDPLDYDVDLEALLEEPVEPPEAALGRLSWAESARAYGGALEGLALRSGVGR